MVAKDDLNRSRISALRPAVIAFDSVASTFDSRFGEWQSVAAQRRAVRAELLRAFPPGGHILELGGGTGEDATFLAKHGFNILLTDPSPTMVALADAKLGPFGAQARVADGEDLEGFAASYLEDNRPLFDGAFSNFAPLNCITDLGPVARGLARLLKPDACAMLVLFGAFCPGEMITESLRGRAKVALRRFKQGEIPARLAGREFSVIYHRSAAIQHAFSPWFVLEQRFGIGVTVPPSAAEPWISRHPHLLAAMEKIDRSVCRPLAALGDHVLYKFRRSSL